MRDLGAAGRYLSDFAGNEVVGVDETPVSLDRPGNAARPARPAGRCPRRTTTRHQVRPIPSVCSSSRSSCGVRAIRRAKLLAVPGKPPGMAMSNGKTSTVSAPRRRRRRPAWYPLPRVALGHHRQRRLRVHHGTAALRLADDLGDPRPQPRAARRLGDRHELVVIGSQPETDLPQSLAHRIPVSGQRPKVSRAGPRRCRRAPRPAFGRQVVESASVDGHRPHAVVGGHPGRDSDDILDGGTGRSLGAVSGSAPRSVRWSVPRRAAPHGVARRRIVGTACRGSPAQCSGTHPSSSRSSWSGAAPDSYPELQRAAPRRCGRHRRVRFSNCSRGAEPLDDL